MVSRGSRERHFANGTIAAFVQRGRLDPQPLHFLQRAEIAARQIKTARFEKRGLHGNGASRIRAAGRCA